MTNSQRLAAVRDHLRRWLSEQVCQQTSVTGVDESVDLERQEQEGQDLEPQDCDQKDGVVSATTENEVQFPTPVNPPEISSESILIRDGFYAGRTFEAAVSGDFVRATWFMEPDELKIRDLEGNVLAVFRGEEIVATPIATDDPADREIISIPMSPAAEASSAPTDGDTGSDGEITKAA